jgi:hypothetical protein
MSDPWMSTCEMLQVIMRGNGYKSYSMQVYFSCILLLISNTFGGKTLP